MRFSGKVVWVVFGGALVALLWLLGAAIFWPQAVDTAYVARLELTGTQGD